MTPGGSQPVDHREQDLRDHALLLVRSGLLQPAAQLEAMVAAVQVQMPDTDATILARTWLAAAGQQVQAAAQAWEPITDHDRLQSAFAECEANGVRVHQAVSVDELRERVVGMEPTARGVVWFPPEAVYVALDTGVLTASLRHVGGVVPEPQDTVVTGVLSCMERHGLPARWHESQLQVATWWRKRL